MKFAKVMVAVGAFFGYAIAVNYGSGSQYSSYGGAAGGAGGVSYSGRTSSGRASEFRGGIGGASYGGSGSEGGGNIGGASSGKASEFRGGVGGVSHNGGSASTRFVGGAGESGRRVLGSAQSRTEDIPQPYKFSHTHNAKGDPDNSHFHYEQRDVSSEDLGSYGYHNDQGLHRIVDYDGADENGYRAEINSYEPGTDAKGSPAYADRIPYPTFRPLPTIRPYPTIATIPTLGPYICTDPQSKTYGKPMACVFDFSVFAHVSSRDFVNENESSAQSYSGASGGDTALKTGLCPC